MNQIKSNYTQNGTFPLNFLDEGNLAEIVEFHKHLPPGNKSGLNLITRLDELGLRPGNIVQMLNSGNSHSILIKIESSRLVIPKIIAMKIFVRS